MQRAMLWFKCAAVHDPVRPVVKKPATIGWEAKQRQVDLVIERSFKGDELLSSHCSQPVESLKVVRLEYSIIPCWRYENGVAKSCMISTYFRNSETLYFCFYIIDLAGFIIRSEVRGVGINQFRDLQNWIQSFKVG
jgi:hypothetical protein